jgi:hypothetical protein
MKVVGEWVESKEEAAALAAIGVDFLQGNLGGEPSITEPWEKSKDEDLLQFAVAPETETGTPSETAPEPGSEAVTDAELDLQLQELKTLLANLHSSFGAKEEGPEKPDDLAIAS